MSFETLRRTVLGALALLVVVGPAPAALGQSGSLPTPAQLEQLRNLPPEQKQQLIELLGGASVPKAPTPVDSLTPDATAADDDDDEEPIDDAEMELLLGPGSTLVIDLLPIVPDEEVEIAALREVVGKAAYTVDARGNLNIPGVGSVYVSGLTAEQAQIRLSAEPSLQDFAVAATVLPLQQTGADALEPFGYELFDNEDATAFDGGFLPVPLDYVIGPGDTLNVQLYGNQNLFYSLTVGRDGTVSLPGSGPFSVSGLTFEEVREALGEQIKQSNIGVGTAVTMGPLRSMQVFVLGDVQRPGAYTVSSLSTVTNALRLSGGPSPSGSMRGIQIKRANRVVGRLDLYDFLLRGNTAGDLRLQPGDAVFVPPVGPQVTVIGEVRRPAIYELRRATELSDLLEVAGGILPSAYTQRARIERFAADDGRRVLTVSLGQSTSTRVEGGDVVTVMPALDRLRDVVDVTGHVQREGPRQWRAGMRASQLLPTLDELRPSADFEYLVVERRRGPDARIETFSFSLTDALARPGSDADPVFEREDRVYVLSQSADRVRMLEPLVERLREQAKVDSRGTVITLSGLVRSPGVYPLEPGMRVSDAIRAGGGLRESAFTGEAELTRFEVTAESGRRETQHFSVNLERILAGSESDDELMNAYDYLSVKEIPEWSTQRTMRIEGEVRFPGEYTVTRGELLSSVISRAGGLTSLAFAEGSVFLREELRERETEQLQRLAARVRREISVLPEDSADARSNAENLLSQLENTEAQGRLVIVLDQLLAMTGSDEHDILVEDGDVLIIPPRQQDVTVVGEVQYTTSHIYAAGLSRADYIQRSGGLTANADKRRIYIVRANGNVLADAGSRWYARNGTNVEIRPGDTIVVPIDPDKISKLALWTSVTQILYNIGIAAAAVSAL